MEDAKGGVTALTIDVSAFKQACAVARNVIQLGEAFLALHELLVDRWPKPISGSDEALGHVLQGLHGLIEVQNRLFRESILAAPSLLSGFEGADAMEQSAADREQLYAELRDALDMACAIISSRRSWHRALLRVLENEIGRLARQVLQVTSGTDRDAHSGREDG